MRNNRVAWAIGGGIAAFFIIITLIIAVIFVELKNNQEPCVGSCAFVSDVRDSGKYSDKTDAEIVEYGNELCTTISSGGATIVYALEDEEIIESAIRNLCPDVVE